jgi:hypothetical protein
MKHYIVVFGDTTRVAVYAKDQQDARQRMIQAACDLWGGRRDDWEYLAANADVYELGENPVWV